MKKFILGFVLFMISTNIWGATSASCNGIDSGGKYVALYMTSNALYINGQNYQIASVSPQAIRTADFIDTKGRDVYDLITRASGNQDLWLYQINAVTGQTLATVYFTCTISGASDLKSAMILR